MEEEQGEIRCPVEGCEHPPFKTIQARDSHVRAKHPESLGEKGAAREVPIVEEDFASLLRKFKISADLAFNIAENISHTGGSTVFEDPDILLTRLTLWSSDIPPAKRKNIIEQWFAERQIDITPEVQRKAGMTDKQLTETEKKTKEEGEVRYVYDTEADKVRMAKEGERGGTLVQAKELKKMADDNGKEGGESPFIMGSDGKWTLNPKARITGIEYMAFQQMQSAQAKGDPVDPVTELTRAAEKYRSLRELMGGGGGGVPSWMADPVTFAATMKNMMGNSGGDKETKEAMAVMQKTIDDLKEDRWREMFEKQQTDIQNLAGVLNKTIETIADVKKGQVGRTEMDIIHEVATQGLNLAKTELPELRKTIKEAVGSVIPPSPKSAEQRAAKKEQFREAINNDSEISEIGQRLFFNQPVDTVSNKT